MPNWRLLKDNCKSTGRVSLQASSIVSVEHIVRQRKEFLLPV
jgi:hypothetical protein